MLGKLSVILVLCQVAVLTYGAALPTTSPTEEESCIQMYVNCTTNEECCDFMRCLDFGQGFGTCQYGTDNPAIPDVGNAIQPPADIINDPGCGFPGDICEIDFDCCSSYVCSQGGICQTPTPDFYGLFPGK